MITRSFLSGATLESDRQEQHYGVEGVSCGVFYCWDWSSDWQEQLVMVLLDDEEMPDDDLEKLRESFGTPAMRAGQ